MIPRLPGWTRDEHGDVVTLTHRDGASAGILRYRERVRPWRTFDQVIAATCAELPDLVDVTTAEPEQLVSDEGELVAIARIEGSLAGSRVGLVAGAVFGDDFYSHLVAHVSRLDDLGALQRMVRLLLRSDRHALGLGRRMTLHRGPPGWSDVRRGLATDWIAPSADAVIRVLPAEPSAHDADPLAAVAASTAEGTIIEVIGGPHDVSAMPGRCVTAWRLATRDAGGVVVRCDLVVVRDALYDYAAVLESYSELAQQRHRAALYELAASIVSRASLHLDTTAAVAALGHWTY